MTPNMSKFVRKNKKHKIISGGHVTAEGKPIKSISESAGVEYSFTDNTSLVLWGEDARSYPEFKPVWDIQ